MTAISAELKTGAANDSGIGSALDPNPHGRRIKPGEGQVSLTQERPQLVDIGARHREVGHDSSLRAHRYPEASTTARCDDHLKPPIGYRDVTDRAVGVADPSSAEGVFGRQVRRS